MMISESLFQIDRPQRSPIGMRTLSSDRIDPDNGGIPPWEDQVTIHSLVEEWAQEDMIADV